MRVYHAGAVKANLSNSYHSQQGGEDLYTTDYNIFFIE
ncbi:Putative ABC-type metal ion transport system, periplasmic component/surface antigen (May be involved in bacterial virulence) [Moritella viscosa]|nr:Putative ABC-type metal ion transport system, periplasmic component/surface antigen (May be involved in bacterial virulence) [Moritella viscosa]